MKLAPHIVALALLLPLTACNRNATPGASVNTYAFKAADGSYTINFPGKPTEKSQSLQTPIGPILLIIQTYESKFGRRAFFSSSVRYNIRPSRYNVEKGLDGARDGSAKNVHGTVNRETKINYRGVPGRQYYIDAPDHVMIKCHIYIDNSGPGPMVYQAFVVDQNGSVDDAEVNRFLDSLTFNPG